MRRVGHEGKGKVSGARAAALIRPLEACIDECASETRHFRDPIETLTERWVTRREYYGWSRLPYLDQRYLDGYHRAVWKALWNSAEWRHWYRGEWVTSDKIERGTWGEIDSDRSQHFWPGTDKPFTRKLATANADEKVLGRR